MLKQIVLFKAIIAALAVLPMQSFGDVDYQPSELAPAIADPTEQPPTDQNTTAEQTGGDTDDFMVIDLSIIEAVSFARAASSGGC